MKHLYLIKQYIQYLLKAKSAHGIHSPFVFDFIETVLTDKRAYYAFDEIEKLRAQLYANNQWISVEDFGAGSHSGNATKRKIQHIAKRAGRSEKMGKLLFRIVQKYQCKEILELGTSLGLGTSYLAKANLNGRIISIEGSKAIAEEASANFKQLQLKNIEQIQDRFDNCLGEILRSHDPFDLIFIDGNHRKKPTLKYFNEFLPYLKDSTILIFDDIHWSKEMNEAWNEIKQHQQVKLSIDLFFLGLVFFKNEMKEKQHFILKC